MKYLILSLLLVVLCFIINQKQENLANQDRYLNYRLSDIIREWHDGTKGLAYRENFTKNFPNTLGAKYIQQHKKRKDLKTLNKIIQKDYIPQLDSLPDKNTVVVHLRVGDVILKKKEKVKGKKYYNYDILIKPWFTYGWQPSKYEKLAHKLYQDNPDYKIVVIFGAHFKENNKISNDYVDNIIQIFKDTGFEITRKHTGNPDFDFSYMCEATHWVAGGGGYSNLITENVIYKKGTVYQVKDY